MVKSKKNGEASKRPASITPEYIAEQRAKKQERLAHEAAERQKAGLPAAPNNENEIMGSYIHRDMLKIGKSYQRSQSRFTFTLMTYNVLAQCNIRRKMFPDSGNALKWTHRSRQLYNELSAYSPSVMCFQELDIERIPNFYSDFFSKFGYSFSFANVDNKRHGIMIAWKTSIFRSLEERKLFYDKYRDSKRMDTKNLGLVVALERVDQPGTGITLSTTHMFWHPMGSYDRVRQGAILVRETQAFSERYGWPSFIAGDFNTEPQDPNYACMTRRPLVLNETERGILDESRNHRFKRKNIEEEGLVEEEQSDAAPASEMSAQNSTPEQEQQVAPSNDRETGLFNDSDAKLNLDNLLESHRRNKQLVSLYGCGYGSVHPENAKNIDGHPAFTNWAAQFTGMLDYIFVVNNQEEQNGNVEILDDNSMVIPGIQLLALLQLPRPEEMRGGEPQEGRFPSDHLAIMAEIAIA